MKKQIQCNKVINTNMMLPVTKMCQPLRWMSHWGIYYTWSCVVQEVATGNPSITTSHSPQRDPHAGTGVRQGWWRLRRGAVLLRYPHGVQVSLYPAWFLRTIGFLWAQWFNTVSRGEKMERVIIIDSPSLRQPVLECSERRRGERLGEVWWRKDRTRGWPCVMDLS